DEVRVEVLDLLLGEVDFLQASDDLVVGEEPLFLPFGDELVQLVDVGQRDIDREHCPPLLLVTSATLRRRNEKSRRVPTSPGSQANQAGDSTTVFEKRKGDFRIRRLSPRRLPRGCCESCSSAGRPGRAARPRREEARGSS